jgi:flagellar biosynthetic protein FlhB
VSDPQRSHKASPKRVREFRKRGDIALSRDVVSAATLTGGFIGLLVSAGTASTALLDLTRNAANASDGSTTAGLNSQALHSFFAATGPAMIGAAVGAVIAMLAQLGWPPAFKLPGFDLSKMSPLANLPNAFGPAAMVRRTGAAVAKLVLVGAIVVLSLRSRVVISALDAGSLGALAWDLIRRSMWLVLGVLVLLGGVDFFLARRRIAEQMKMTGEELKREHREQDGDPMVKGRRRQRMRELAKRRLVANVTSADVIVVNPTHYAVALRYDDKQDAAPMVVAKGVDEQAEKIREIARAQGVPILSRPPLARALYKHVKEGRAVPSNLYRAVAEVLAYIYRLRQGSNR